MIRIFLFLLLLSSTSCTLGLNHFEIEALSDLFHQFPKLASLSPPWTNNTADACGSAKFQGVTCDANNYHVIALYVDE